MEQFIEFTNNNPLLVSSCVGLFLLAVFNELKIKEADVCGLSTIDAIKLINKNCRVVDLRSLEAYEKKHLSDSTNMAKSEITEGFINKQTNPVLFVCETGGDSKKTSLVYRKKGLENVFYIKGGLIEWENNSLPLTN